MCRRARRWTWQWRNGTFGSASRKGPKGYVCVQKGKYFEAKDTRGAAEPDEGVAAMRGARFVVVDEFSGKAEPLNATLIKTWTDTDGTPIPFERKYGSREELVCSWLLVMFTNVLPPIPATAEGKDDTALLRRLSVVPMLVQFKAPEDVDPQNATHKVVDNTLKKRVATFGPFAWFICYVPHLTVVRPRASPQLFA